MLLIYERFFFFPPQEWMWSCGHMSTHMRGCGLCMAIRSAGAFLLHPILRPCIPCCKLVFTNLLCFAPWRYSMAAENSLTWTPKLQSTLSQALLWVVSRHCVTVNIFVCRSVRKVTVKSTEMPLCMVNSSVCAAAGLLHEFSTICSSD